MANLTNVLNFRSNLTGADIKSNYDATDKDEVGCDSSGRTFTITLPASESVKIFGTVGVDAEFNTYYGQGLTVAPAITTAIPAALTQVAANKLNAFALTFNEFCTALSVTAQHRENWATIAQSFNPPSDFVNVVRGGN